MKTITEKDLSLDKQVVSNLSGNTSTYAGTENCINEAKSEDFQCETNDPACEVSYNANTCRCTEIPDCTDSLICHHTDSMYQPCCDVRTRHCPPESKECYETYICPETHICDTQECLTDTCPETYLCDPESMEINCAIPAD